VKTVSDSLYSDTISLIVLRADSLYIYLYIYLYICLYIYLYIQYYGATLTKVVR
jgi:hypothetical protein